MREIADERDDFLISKTGGLNEGYHHTMYGVCSTPYVLHHMYIQIHVVQLQLNVLFLSLWVLFLQGPSLRENYTYHSTDVSLVYGLLMPMNYEWNGDVPLLRRSS